MSYYSFFEALWALTEILQFQLYIAIVQDTCRMGVWLGWHICYNATQVSQGQLRENRNLSLSIRAKAVLIYVLSVTVHNEQVLAMRNCSQFTISSSCVKARPSDPFVYVWILWFYAAFAVVYACFALWFNVLSRVRENLLRCIFTLRIVTFNLLLFAARGVRKVTTGITGLWPRSVQSDAAFWFFDVGSSYPAVAYGRKGKFVHLPTGNVSWV